MKDLKNGNYFNLLKSNFNIVVQEFSGFFKPEMNCTFKEQVLNFL